MTDSHITDEDAEQAWLAGDFERETGDPEKDISNWEEEGWND